MLIQKTSKRPSEARPRLPPMSLLNHWNEITGIPHNSLVDPWGQRTDAGLRLCQRALSLMSTLNHGRTASSEVDGSVRAATLAACPKTKVQTKRFCSCCLAISALTLAGMNMQSIKSKNKYLPFLTHLKTKILLFVTQIVKKKI